MQSDPILMSNQNPYFKFSKLSENDSIIHYYGMLNQEFFAEWGEVWTVQVYKGTSPIHLANQDSFTFPSTPELTMVCETEHGVVSVPIAIRSGKIFTTEAQRQCFLFPHKFRPDQPLFSYTRIKTTRRKKNAVPSLQQDPF